MHILILCALGLLLAPLANAEWFDPDWNYRKPVTLQATLLVTGTHNDFPALIRITDTDLAANSRPDGFDILFTSADGITQLDHEIERYNSATGELVAWVRLPTLSSTSDTPVWLYYGNPASANQQNTNAVWDASYRMIQHLNEASGPGNFLLDSSASANHGAPLGSTPNYVEARINGGYDFSGNNQQRIEVPDSASLRINGQLTAEAWAYVRSGQPAANPPLNAAAPVNPILWKGSRLGWGTDYLFRIAVRDPTQMTWGISCGGLEAWFSAGAPLFDQWAHYALTFDGSVIRAYINGEQVGSRTSCNGVNLNVMSSQPVRSGFGFREFAAQQTHLNGIVDELRISATARSANWLATQHAIHSNPDAFLVIGDEETAEPSLSIIRSVSTATPTPGDTVEHEITISNTGGGFAQETVVDESLPVFQTFVADAFGPGQHVLFEDDAIEPSGLTVLGLEWSEDGISYLPMPGPPGWQTQVRFWRMSLDGSMPPGSQFQVRYQITVDQP